MEMSGSCGYDEQFVDPPAEYFKCAVCCLVLKQPLQIATCGHRYCSVCYNRIKVYARNHNMLFTCPVDRKEIDETKVFDDMGMARLVFDLRVRCSSHRHGCGWIGELRELSTHKNICPYIRKQLPHDFVNDDNALPIAKLCNRVDKCEDSLLEKEKELGHLKLLLQQLQQKVDQRDEGWNLLKTKNVDMEGKIVSLEEANEELRKDLATALCRLQSLEEQLQDVKLAPLVQSDAWKTPTNYGANAKRPKLDQYIKKDAHLYMNVQVLQENSFCMWSGDDLFNPITVKPDHFKLLKKTNIKDANKMIAEGLGYTEAQCRIWPYMIRHNGTSRPSRPVPFLDNSGETDDTSLELFTINDGESEMLIFLETCQVKRGLFVLPELDGESVLLFFKYYNPVTETLTYCGHAYVGVESEPTRLFPMLCERAGLPKGTQLLLYEEVTVSQIEEICMDKPFDQAVVDITDGDIICFQTSVPNSEQFTLPTPVEYFKQKSMQQK